MAGGIGVFFATIINTTTESAKPRIRVHNPRFTRSLSDGVAASPRASRRVKRIPVTAAHDKRQSATAKLSDGTTTGVTGGLIPSLRVRRGEKHYGAYPFDRVNESFSTPAESSDVSAWRVLIQSLRGSDSARDAVTRFAASPLSPAFAPAHPSPNPRRLIRRCRVESFPAAYVQRVKYIPLDISPRYFPRRYLSERVDRRFLGVGEGGYYTQQYSITYFRSVRLNPITFETCDLILDSVDCCLKKVCHTLTSKNDLNTMYCFILEKTKPSVRTH